MATNFFGPLYTLQAALPSMREHRSGTIVNVSSVAARDPQPACSLYCASKAALEGATESLAREVAPHNIRVLIVEPGNFRTNFVSAVSFPRNPDLTLAARTLMLMSQFRSWPTRVRIRRQWRPM